MRLFTLLFVWGCGINYQQRELPSLYERSYAPIAYTDYYTEQESAITKFWAQEAMGAPEARGFIQQLVNDSFSFKPSKVGVVDGGFNEGILDARLTPELREFVSGYDFSSLSDGKEEKESRQHGTRVINLIAGQAPAGVSSRAEVDYLSNKSVTDVKTEYLPPVINYSMGFFPRYLWLPGGGSRMIYLTTLDDDENDKLVQVSERSILVKAAGNDFPLSPSSVIVNHGDEMVVVGSADPSGFISWFSQASEQVVLLAPSDYYLSVLDEGNLRSFGGTSGSAPLVTSIVADLRSILPTLTRDEIVYLLRKTAIVSGATLAHDNSAYIVNHYRALRVAYRLADRGFVNDSSLLKDSEIYNFHTESWQMFIGSKTASSYRQRFLNLRLAFFLNPADLVVRRELAEVYRQCGYDSQALFYSQPYHAEAKQKAQLRNSYPIKYFLKIEKDNFAKWLKNEREMGQIEIEAMTVRLDAIRLQATSHLTEIDGYSWGDALVTYIKGADNHGNQILSNTLREYARATYPEMLNNETLDQLID